jgi:hypothetical protein
MKLRAGRGRRDVSDVGTPLAARGVSAVAQAVDILEAHPGAEVLPERFRLQLEARFGGERGSQDRVCVS